MKYNHPKSKKAQVLSEALILLVTIAVCTYAFYAAYSFDNDYSKKLAVPVELLNAYGSQDSFELYAKDSAKLSVNEAWSNSLKSYPQCKIIANDNIPIWSSECVSKNNFEETFLKEIDSQFGKMLNVERKYKISLGDKIQFEFEPVTVNISGEDYVGTYQYKTLFSVENPLKENPEQIYQKLMARMKDCKSGSGYDSCINKLILDNYTINCVSDKYLICSLETKQIYPFSNSFGRITTNFAVNM